VARSLEQFREVMASIIPSSADAKEPPRVVVFRSRQAMTPYLPQFEGRPVESAGVFIQSSDASYIIMDGAISGPGDPIVFHEYTHFLVRRALPDVPVWVSEGLAEFYAMFQERDGGRAALIGAPAPQHLQVLRRQTLIPLHELAAVDHSSPMYNEGARRGVFYAQSWALVHYLLMGKTRTQQFNTYLTAIQGGTPAQEAFAATFGSEMPALERELRDYIAAFLFPVVTFKFADRIRGRADDDPTALADHEAQSYLADLVGALGRTEEARARFKEILAGNPDAPLALRGSGLLELQFGRANDAMPLLERAAELRPDDGRVLEALGRGLYGRAEEAMDRQERERLTDRARETLARADTLGASSPSMLAALGYLESVGSTPESLERATAYLERAVRLEPTNEELRLRLASVLVYRKELDAATTILGRLLATGCEGTCARTAGRSVGASPRRVWRVRTGR
jgi:tetratricopeptide (TPR) repeat protein